MTISLRLQSEDQSRSVSVRATDTSEGSPDLLLDVYDNTKLTAINTCPTWGLVRYDMHKAMPGAGRAMALEAGSASHEVYAAARLLRLWEMDHPFHYAWHGARLFGAERWEEMQTFFDDDADRETNRINFPLGALHTGPFYDDPGDKRRTLAKIEESCIAYLQRWNWDQRVWVASNTQHEEPVGIEVPVDVVITWHDNDADMVVRQIRFVGMVDGISYIGETEGLEIQENKTASRLGEAWSMSFLMAHQVTGYMVGMTPVLHKLPDRARVIGMSIPLPVSYDSGGIANEIVYREEFMLWQWFDWVGHTVDLANMYKRDPVNAPKYTHSCNRYFRPCSFIALCASPPDEREEMIKEMVTDEWNPLDQAVESKASD